MEPNIFLFIPNVIGYLRIILLFISCCFMLTNPALASTLYMTCVILDEVDGWAARKFNQCSTFGAAFDIAIDLCTTSCILLTLGHLYPSYLLLFQVLAASSISRMWLHNYFTLLKGQSSHKVSGPGANPVLKIYYIPAVLSTACIGNELFLVSLYMLYFTTGIRIPLLGHDAGAWTLVAIATFPIFFLKQCVHILQLVLACQSLVSLDIAQRKLKS